MPTQPASVAELIADALRAHGHPGRPWSYRKAAAYLSEAGFPLSPETLRRLATGDSRQPDDSTLQALIALGIDERRLMQAAGISAPETYEPFHLPIRANQLTREQRRVILATIDAFLAKDPSRHDGLTP